MHPWLAKSLISFKVTYPVLTGSVSFRRFALRNSRSWAATIGYISTVLTQLLFFLCPPHSEFRVTKPLRTLLSSSIIKDSNGHSWSFTLKKFKAQTRTLFHYSLPFWLLAVKLSWLFPLPALRRCRWLSLQNFPNIDHARFTVLLTIYIALSNPPGLKTRLLGHNRDRMAWCWSSNLCQWKSL